MVGELVMEKNNKYSILIIDDEKSDIMVLNTILSSDYIVFIAKSGHEGIEYAVKDKPDLILLDIVMPGMSGFEVLKIIKEMPDMQHIPVIIISGLDNEGDEEKGFFLGAVDYIKKPFKGAIVKARVKTHIQIVQQIRTIERLGLIDALTDIPNRRCFDDRIVLEWRRARREQRSLSFLMMDVDKFKDYNDTYGHPQGDTLLKAVAKIFAKAAMRPADLCARIGGEEFAVILPDTDLNAAVSIAEKIRSEVEELRIPTADGKIITTTTLSIGVTAIVPDSDITMEACIARADANLYTAKEGGRNRVCY
jgi:diguanylate cyclase (GGDEF)-like protein